MAHLSDDEAVAKMGHPNLDVGHPGVRALVAVAMRVSEDLSLSFLV
jgi:hypothetical protein